MRRMGFAKFPTVGILRRVHPTKTMRQIAATVGYLKRVFDFCPVTVAVDTKTANHLVDLVL